MNERDWNLIHEAIDGEPSDADALQRLLAENPDAAQLHDELSRLDRVLQAVPPLEPPADLKDAILSRARSPARRESGSWLAILGGWLSPAPLRFALTFVGGAAVGVALLMGLSDLPVDANGLQGALVPVGMAPAMARPVDRAEIDSAMLSGTIELLQAEQDLYLRFSLVSRQAMAMDVDLGGEQIAFQAFQQTADPALSLLAENDRLTVQIHGHQQFLLSLQQRGSEGTRIQVRFLVQGALIKEVALNSDRFEPI